VKTENRRAEHPDFHWCAENGASPIVFVFDRLRYKKPSPEQLAEYERQRAIVEALGGRMLLQDYQIAGRNEPFTEADCAEMIAAAERANPDLELDKHWNGAGDFSFTVGMRRRA